MNKKASFTVLFSCAKKVFLKNIEKNFVNSFIFKPLFT